MIKFRRMKTTSNAPAKTGPALRYRGLLPSHSYEVVHRFALILLAGITIGWATASYLPLLWSALYIIVNGAYQASLVRNRATKGVLPLWRRIIGLLSGTSIYIAMIIYLWLHENFVLQFAATSGLIGYGLHSLARPQKILWVTIVDSLAIASIYIFMVLTLIITYQDGPTLAVLAACLFSVVTYFITSQWRAYKRSQAIEVAEQRLMRNREMEAVGRLTGAFAHDFNNILTAMRGNLDLYDEVTDPVEKRRIMQEAQAATARAANLTQQLLTYSGKAILRPQHIATGAFVTDFVAMMGRNLPEEIALRLEVCDNPPPLKVDVQTLEMVLTNLVRNAADAIVEQCDIDGRSVAGEITLSCAPMAMPASSAAPAASEIRAGNYLRLALLDTGPGIPADVLPHICEPFYTTKPLGRGSGLGLAMAQGFAEQSGGALRVSNPSEGGALVELFLPLTRAE